MLGIHVYVVIEDKKKINKKAKKLKMGCFCLFVYKVNQIFREVLWCLWLSLLKGKRVNPIVKEFLTLITRLKVFAHFTSFTLSNLVFKAVFILETKDIRRALTHKINCLSIPCSHLQIPKLKLNYIRNAK